MVSSFSRVHPVGAVRLHRPKLEALWPHDETSRESEGTAVPVNVAPTNREPNGAGSRPSAQCLRLQPPCGRREPWLPNWTTKEFVRARRAAAISSFRLHDVRHFMATEMLAAGVPIVTVSQRLSHARV